MADLPPGWIRKDVVRTKGKSSGTKDRYIFNSNGKKFRSFIQVEKWLNGGKKNKKKIRKKNNLQQQRSRKNKGGRKKTRKKIPSITGMTKVKKLVPAAPAIEEEEESDAEVKRVTKNRTRKTVAREKKKRKGAGSGGCSGGGGEGGDKFVPKTIIVIGAGVSGLACSRHLMFLGHKVIVLEGRDRIGGRVHTLLPTKASDDDDGDDGDDDTENEKQKEKQQEKQQEKQLEEEEKQTFTRPVDLGAMVQRFFETACFQYYCVCTYL